MGQNKHMVNYFYLFLSFFIFIARLHRHQEDAYY